MKSNKVGKRTESNSGGCEDNIYDFINTLGLGSKLFPSSYSKRVDYLPKQFITSSRIK